MSEILGYIPVAFGVAWAVTFVIEKILHACGRPGSALGRPGRGGWCPIKRVAYLAELDTARRWTARDQLRLEIRSPVIWALWLTGLGNVLAGIALADIRPLAVASFIAILYGWMLHKHLQLIHRARVCELPIVALRGPTFFSGGIVTVRHPVTEKGIPVTVPWRACQALIDRHGAVEIMALADENQGVGLAVRPAPPSSP